MTHGTGIPGTMTRGTGDVPAITGAGTAILGTIITDGTATRGITTITTHITTIAGTLTAGTAAETGNTSTGL